MGPEVRILSPRPLSRYYTIYWLLGQAVKTPPSHGGYRSSNLLGVTTFFALLGTRAFSSVGQSGRLITDWSAVRVREGPPKNLIWPGSSAG